MEKKSRILIVGATGKLGFELAKASLQASHPTFALVRDSAFSDPLKSLKLQSLSDQGASLLKRFIPSEFGLDPGKTRISGLDNNFYARKAEIRHLVEAEGIPHTYICCNFFMSYLLPSLVQPGLKTPPMDKVTIFGNGNVKGVFMKESDVAAFTISAVDDPRTLNKAVHLRPQGNVYSMNELVELWEGKIGKKLEKIYVPEEELLKKIKAVALQLPLLNPYLDRNASFDHGANFAVAGSTALDTSFLAARGIQPLVINIPLSAQLNWFRTLLTSTCPTPAECRIRLRRALVFMGEIGGDDFNYAFTQGKSIQELQDLVPDVVGAIINAVREVIRLGAIRITVPGNFPVGCFPFALTALANADPGAYDDLGCLRSLNDFAVFQNNYLQGALASLRQEFPQAIILYADYYSSFQSVLRHAPALGFEAETLLKSCCGIGGPYNFDINRFCGSQDVPLCPNPNRYIFWDGLHLTQEAYQRISEILIPDILSRIQCIW